MVHIESSQLFGGLGAADLQALRTAAVEKTFDPGREIFREGEPGDGFYLIRDGQVEISARVADNRRQVISVAGPGDIFGEMSVVDDRPRSAGAAAKTQTIAWFIPRTEALRLMEGSSALALAILREISGRLREFNQQYLREVVQAERLAIVGRFARSIIHDLKNPLSVIGLKAEIAGMGSTSAEVRASHLKDIRAEVDRINELVDEILQFAKGSSNTVVLSQVDYGDFVRQVLGGIRAETVLRNVEVELREPVPGARLLMHPKRLSRVFHNLVQNAVEEMRDGGRVIVNVTLRGSEVVTEVEDTGPGIAPEIADQLFQPFATFGKENGTGLGLSICKRIIEDHQGWIRARHAAGRGAIFTFGLPCVAAPPAAT